MSERMDAASHIKYNRVMECVTMTEEMRMRVMNRLQNADLSARSSFRKTLFLNHTRYLAVAACLVLAVVGVMLFMRHHAAVPEPLPQDGVITPWGSVVYHDAEALSDAVGFDVADLTQLPFEPTETSYQKYDGGMAEINYQNGEQRISFRKSKGTEDNSGDYNEYENVFQKVRGDVNITFEGSGEEIAKVTFMCDGYFISLTASPGLTQQQWNDILNAMLPQS